MAAVDSWNMVCMRRLPMRRACERRGTYAKDGRMRGAPCHGKQRLLILSGIDGVATALIARMPDLNDETAACFRTEAGAPAHYPQSIGPVR